MAGSRPQGAGRRQASRPASPANRGSVGPPSRAVDGFRKIARPGCWAEVTAVKIHVLDTTLSEIALSFNTRIAPGDRLRILRKLEELRPDYIEVDAETYLGLGDCQPSETRLSVFTRRAEDL